MTQVPADRPHYSTGTPVPDHVDSSTKEYSRGTNPATGAKTSEPAEPVPTVSAVSGGNLPVAGGGAPRTLTGDNLGGSTGATIGGTAVTSWTVVSETQATFVPPAKTAGTQPLIVQNPAGASASFNVTYA